MAQPINPRTTKRLLFWHRVGLCLLAGVIVGMFAGGAAWIAIKAAKARPSRATAMTSVEAEALAKASGEAAAKRSQREADLETFSAAASLFLRAKERVEVLSAQRPVDAKALAEARSRMAEAEASLVVACRPGTTSAQEKIKGGFK